MEEWEKELEKLPPAQREWVKNWIDGIAWMIARSRGEPEEETRKEYEQVKKLLMEKVPELIRYSERWKQRLKEALGL